MIIIMIIIMIITIIISIGIAIATHFFYFTLLCFTLLYFTLILTLASFFYINETGNDECRFY